MEEKFVDYGYLADRLYKIILDGEHKHQLEAIRILLTMGAGHYRPYYKPEPEDEVAPIIIPKTKSAPAKKVT